jgi:predicted nucleotidyltransferase
MRSVAGLPYVHKRTRALMAAMERAAFLSVRLPPEVRNRVKAAAAARGQTVQELVGSLVERFLAEQNRGPPALPAALARLRGQEAELRQRGIAGLWVFGSVARGEAQPNSDIDLIAEFDPGTRLSLTGLASLRADLADLLGTPVDLVEWTVLKSPVHEQAEREAVRVF